VVDVAPEAPENAARLDVLVAAAAAAVGAVWWVRCGTVRETKHRTEKEKMRSISVAVLAEVRARRAHRARRNRKRALNQQTVRTRNRVPRKEMVWSERLQQLSAVGFRRRYCMSKEAFAHLANLLRPIIESDRSDAVKVEIQLSSCLQMLVGGSYLDVADMHGLNETHVHAIFDRTVFAIATILKLPFETGKPSESDLHALATGFAKHTGGTWWGCVGSIDGVQIKIEKPAENSVQYYCRKGFYAVNVQAICDS
jgi:hypothetical protein